MSTIAVCPLSGIDDALSRLAPSAMLSMAGPGKSLDRPAVLKGDWLALEFNDIPGPIDGLTPPSRADVAAIIDFGLAWSGDAPLLCQCWMGVSRSTASALIIAAARQPERDMDALAKALRAASPMATPNPMLIRLADEKLQLNGRLSRAVSAIGRGADCYEGTPFQLKI